MTRQHWVVGVGANVGSTASAFELAREFIGQLAGEVVAVSPAYRTPPMGPEQPDYRNGAIRVDSSLPPLQLLDALMRIERAVGRDRRREARWGPRTLDLDVLHGFGTTIDEPRLTVPHPRLRDRAFALRPLLDVAPELEPDLGPCLAGLHNDPIRRADAPRVCFYEHGASAFAREPLHALAAAVGAACRGDAGLSINDRRVIPFEAPAPHRLADALMGSIGGSHRIAALHVDDVRTADARSRHALIFGSSDAKRLQSLELTRTSEGWRAMARSG